jgi:tetratricopeptide (TPR) repeat protein
LIIIRNYDRQFDRCLSYLLHNRRCFLFARGAVYRQLGDFNSAIDDYLMAMSKTGNSTETEAYKSARHQLLLTYNDFAIECLSKQFFGEALLLLNKAIKEEKREKGLYFNRGG